MAWRYLLAAVIGYLLGSVSTGILVAKVNHGPDLHKVGSGNVGASNVLRTMGARSGAITFLGDYFKAVAACLIGLWLTGSHDGMLAAGLAVVVGHNWPVFFGFEGGKGVAASTAVMVCCYWQWGLIGYAVAIGLIALTRYISLGSMVMLVLYAVLVILFEAHGNIWIILWAVALAAMCLIRHRSNITRLLSGTERKIGQKEKIS